MGNAVIDSEHRNLIRMARDVMREIRNGDATSLLEAVNLFESCLRIHFANEEKIARAIGFDFNRHGIGQQRLLKEFQRMRTGLTTRNIPWSGDAIKHFYRHLKNWVVDEHIIRLDTRMKPALQPLGYGFLPGGEDHVSRHARKRPANMPIDEIRVELPPVAPKADTVRNTHLLTPPALPFNWQKDDLAFSFRVEND